MQLGTTLLGRMGAHLTRRLMRDGHEVWRALTASALGKSPDLGGYSGRVSDSGEGRWTVAATEAP